jgi:uncharacterized membrane protein
MTTPVRLPRGRRTVPSVITAIVLLVIFGVASYLAVFAALHRSTPGVRLAAARNWLGDTHWSASSVLIIGIVLGVLGVVLLLIALLPSTRHVVELVGPDAHTAVGLPKKSLRRTVQASTVAIDGIASASATIGRRTVAVNASSSLRHAEGLAEAVNSAATARLEALNLRQPRTVIARLHTKDS